jgi:cobalt-zinc-cadmium efflux system outer membrane protein
LALARAVASRERMKLEQQLATAELRLQTRVQIAFCEALLAQREIELTTQLVRFSREGISSVETLQRAGEVGQADVLQAQVELEAASMLQAAAEQRRLAAWREFGALLGSTDLPIQPLSGDIAAVAEPLDFGATLIEVQARSPEVAAAVVEIQRARYALARARVEPTPNINFQGLYNWQDNGIGGGDDGAVQVLLPVPLFNRNQGAIAAAQCELVAARQALREIQQQLQQRLAGTLQEYETARMQAERYRTSLLPSAAKSLDLTRELYGAGETNYTALLTAQRTYSQLSRSYLEAVSKLRTAEAQLEGLLVDSADAKP